MAEPLLSFVAERIIEALCSPAVKQIGLFWDVKDELQSLTDTVSTINDVLLDAEDKQTAGNRAVKRWLGRLEDAMYDADDLLDEISTEALRRDIMTRECDEKAKKNQLAYRFKMGHKIKAMRKRLDAINADRQNFHLEVRRVEPRVGNRERDNTHSLVRAETVIGREDDKKAVIDFLLDSNVEDNVSILPIVGIGGLGKTTLAQFVFNDDQIQKHFELKMWVCVYDFLDIKNIVAKALESAAKEKPADAEIDTLVGKLREKFQGKKYFLVLDDVWNGDHGKWCRLKQMLMGGARGSRIVVTTRNEIVAKTIGQESVAGIIGAVESYSLKGLDEEASWSLFKHKAFERGQEPENSSMVALGKEIVKKCSGVPLAITTIGSLLGSKNSEAEWVSFKKNELSKLSQNVSDLLPTLKLSFDHLPSHLKQCFAYCSLFPKDYVFCEKELVQLWIAQGFVKSCDDESRCLEEVGTEYFMDLQWRSFFQEALTTMSGLMNKCKMHDLMHDLAISVAGSGSLMATLGDKETNLDEKTRHLSLLIGYDKPISSLCEASRIRSFLFLKNYMYKIDCDAIFSSFKFLRMLDLWRRDLDYVPSSIGELKHLRCLNLSSNKNIKKLPDSITRLQNLQTLGLSCCRRLEELPRDLKKLVNLRHLKIDFCDALTYMPRGLGQLNNLETLSRFVVHSGSHFKNCGDLRELNGLNKLRGSLEIKNLGHGKDVALEFKALNLKEKQHLHDLSLEWRTTEGDVNDWGVVDDKMPSEGFQPPPNLKHLHLNYYRGSRLPNWVCSLTNLVRLWLRDCRTLKSVPLQHLTSVQELSIMGCVELELANDEDGMKWQGLTNLLALCFSGLPNLVSLPSGLQHATTLQNLRIRNCESLKAIPEWIHNFKSLQHFEIYRCSSLTSLPEGMGRLMSLKRLIIWDCPIFLQRCKKDTGEDWPKIAHIPSLTILQQEENSSTHASLTIQGSHE
ncbi:putative disease resistance protein RGA3 [Corylus avellana]|uniref:putative disease resistance protein RGA3 n=1 Tax=Corylus avellana TaxID=13451 RepID=UPI00286CF363|nr:putative disease resistance protein RGA3 [Corylus avellana]